MVFQVAQDRELVQCATHKVQRLAKFCTSEFIYNADRIPVDVLYRCNSSSICTRPANSAAGGGMLNNNFSTTDNVQDRRMTSERLQLLEGASAAAAASSGDNNKASSTNQNAKGRYYDLSSQNTQRVGPKKVCWACGMSDHEKPTCPNILCKRCHGKYRQDGAPSSTEFSGGHHNHVCEDPILSPFILLDDTLLKDNAQLMTSVRCVRCDQFGHFDCSTIEDVEAAKAYNGSLSAADSAASGTTTATLSMAAKQMSGLLVPHCSYCGAKGHHGFDCPKQDFPDRWVQGVRAAGRRAGFTDSSTLSSSSSFAASGPYNNFNSSAAAAPQQIASSATTVGQPTHRRYNPQGAVGANAAYNSAANSYANNNNNNYNSNYNSYNNSRNSNFVAMESSFGGGGGGGGAYVQSARYQRDQQGYAQQQYGSGAHYQNNNNRNSNSQWRQGYVAPQQQQQQQQEYYTQPRNNQNSSYGGGGRGDATRDTNRSSRHSNSRYAERDSYNNSNNNNKSSHHQHRSQDRKRRRYSSSDDEDRMQF